MFSLSFVLSLAFGLILVLGAMAPAFAQDATPTADKGDNDIQPAPPSIGADVPLTYFGPAPSQVQKELIGPYQLLRSGEIDQAAGTITLPLYEG